MKSKSYTFIVGILILGVIGAGGYFFVAKKEKASVDVGLVSNNATLPQGGQNTNSQSVTGNQVVTILRNLSAIKLDDSVFRNPAFALLTDISISLPPVTNQGRRNPFAPVGTDTSITVPITITTSTTGGGPSF